MGMPISLSMFGTPCNTCQGILHPMRSVAEGSIQTICEEGTNLGKRPV